MIAVRIKKWWIWWVIIPSCFASWNEYVDDYDAINIARCDAKCDGYSPVQECMAKCLSANYTKPGNCPEENSMSPFEAACLVACANDSQCSDFAKCCTNDCGITCMMPTGLDQRDDLPPVPLNIKIRRENSTAVILNWSTSRKNHETSKFKQVALKDEASSIRYLVEERHVLGPRYLESRLSSWSVRDISSKPHASIRNGLKTGHWYQFRIAAVNENGSKGYSEPSVPLKTAAPKNPREPRNLSLSGARVQPTNGNLRILLRWKQPPSDVPIMFYKLFWSRFIRGPPNDSILVHHQSVPKEKNCYEIKNLEIGFQYFLQVQAISLYGAHRLASRKASIVFNSTDYEKYAVAEGRSGRCEKHNVDLRVRRLICQCDNEIEARLVWPSDALASSYNISWREDGCQGADKSKDRHTRNTYSKITHKTRYDVKGLQKACNYRIQVQSILNDDKNKLSTSKRTLTVEFITKNCQRRQSRSDDRKKNSSSRCKKRKARIKRLDNIYS